jgi:hypothetical protein
MRCTLIAALVSLSCLFSCGEVVSISTIVTAEKQVKDEAIIGRWRSVAEAGEAVSDQKEFQIVETPKGYDVREVGAAQSSSLKVRVDPVELGGVRFLDLRLEATDQAASFMHGLAVHRVVKYAAKGDRLSLHFLSFERLAQMVEQGSAGLAILRVENGNVVDRFSPFNPQVQIDLQQLVLCEPTERLQDWLAKHAEDPDLWGPETAYERVPEPPVPTMP